MFIDADCHISSRETDSAGSIDQLLRDLDALGVGKAICWPKVSLPREIFPDNRAIHEGAEAHPDRVIPFCGVNPCLRIEEAKEELSRCIEVYGVKGVKLNGARDGYYIDDPELSLPLIDMIVDAGLVLALHCGSNDFEKTHPFRIAKVSDLHPNLSILVVHMGGAGRPDLHDAAIEFATRYANWYLVDSEADYRKVHKALRILGPDRVCYGSDSPFCPMRFEWAIRQVIYRDLSDTDRAKVLGGNIARLLQTQS